MARVVNLMGIVEGLVSLAIAIGGIVIGVLFGRFGAERKGRKLEREEIADDLMKANEENDREIREALDHRGQPDARAVRDRLLKRLSTRSTER